MIPGKLLWGPLKGPHVECGPLISSHCEGQSSTELLGNQLPIVKIILSWMV